jgi:hypothetical protein
MAVKGIATVDGIEWEGSTTFSVHTIYVGVAATNPHDPEVLGQLLVTGMPIGNTQPQLEAALAQAVRDKLIDDHGFTFDVGDTVRVLGSAL